MGLTLTIVGLLTVWSALALWYQLPAHGAARIVAVGAWLLFAVTLLVTMVSRPLPGRIGFAVAFAAIAVWWWRRKPSRNRRWADDVAEMTHGSLSGDIVVLRNVRNFEWRTRDDYVPRWETRTYDLSHLMSVDMITSYWSYRAIAHVLVSFGFANGSHVVFSVEIRRERTQAYSEIGGFFKEFELSIIAADERDIIRVRTNVRGEDDFLYRVQLSAAARRALFLAYVEEANGLVTTPRFYNTLTANCTMLVYHMMCNIVGHLPLDYRLIFSGYLPGYVYQVGGLDRRYPLADLTTWGRITDRARAADRSAEFSAAIRAGIPPLPDA